MRILVIRASGQLGRALSGAFATDHEMIGTGYRHLGPGQIALDLAAPDSTQVFLDEVRPAVIHLTGAFRNVHLCEQEAEACRRVNVDGVRVVAEHPAKQGSRVVLYSTDHVFDGTRDLYRNPIP